MPDNRSLIAPDRSNIGSGKPWEGKPGLRLPWHYPISVMIPVLDTPDELALTVDLWKASSPTPFIVIVDTGSRVENLEAIRGLRAPGVVVLEVPVQGVRHASEFVAIACDAGLAAAQTPVMIFTHSDVFIRERQIPQQMIERCNVKYPAVGYRMSPRDHPDSRWMLSHTLTALHVPTADRIGLTWSMRRCFARLGTDYTTAGMVGVTWPDTESGFNYVLRDNGITPFFLGEEQNAVRHVDSYIDHCRSMTCSKLYSPGHYAMCRQWLDSARSEAIARLAEWNATPVRSPVDTRGRYKEMIPLGK